jgi:hypothetical protein
MDMARGPLEAGVSHALLRYHLSKERAGDAVDQDVLGTFERAFVSAGEGIHLFDQH